MINKNQECDIISDLLPLYLEHRTSEETGEFVREHLECCRECSRNLELMATSYEEIFDKDKKTDTKSNRKKFSKNKLFGKAKGKIFVFGYLFFLFCWWLYIIACYI